MDTMVNACKAWGAWRNVHKNLLPRTFEDLDIVFSLCARRAGDRALTVSQLIANCLGSRNTVLRRLRALIDSGFVLIRAPIADRRLRELALTRKGERFARKATAGLRTLAAAVRERR
jgi:DNA-binding MarR family transcriptional regulator